MLTNFYTIETIAEQSGEYTCTIRLHPKHPIYKGHFPGMPVVPGVCMLYMVKGCVSAVWGYPIRFQTIASCKFLSVINPMVEEALTIVLSLNDSSRLQAVASADGVTVLKLKATIVAE